MSSCPANKGETPRLVLCYTEEVTDRFSTMPAPLFKPGQSGNPSGRRALAVEVREMMQTNGAKGVERLCQLLEMDENFHHLDADGVFVEGRLTGKEQIAVAALAQDRAYGRSETVSISHTHSGSVGLNVHNKLNAMSAKLPERIAQQRIIDHRIEEAEMLDGALPNGMVET